MVRVRFICGLDGEKMQKVETWFCNKERSTGIEIGFDGTRAVKYWGG